MNNNLISKNLSLIETPKPKKTWINLSKKTRIKFLSDYLKKSDLYKDFIVTDVNDIGFVTLKIEQSIAADQRGVLLLDLEEKLKKEFDESITIWLVPVGDKSKLRMLRGIKVKS